MKIYASRVSYRNYAQYQQYLQVLSPQYRTKILRYRQPEDSCRAITSILLLRQIIKMHLSFEFTDDMLDYNEYGKPFLSEYPSFHFNLSHSGHWVICAVDKTPIGIDIEKVQALDCIALAKDFFCQEEYQELVKKNGFELLDFFYSIWTAKESYIKALGKGMSISLDSFAISITENQIFVKPKDLQCMSRKMFFKQYEFDHNYKLTVCAEHPDFPEEIFTENIMN